MALSDCELLKIMKKFQESVKQPGKYQAALRKAKESVHPLTMDTMPETTGTPEMQDIEKREYGFDFEKSKGLDVDAYRPEG